MIVHQVFAQIHNGEVKNVIVCDNYELANWLARATYGLEAIAVDCLQYPCGPGDHYHNGVFYKVLEDGAEQKIEYVPTQEQQVQMLNMEAEQTAEHQMDLDYRLSVTELGL